MSDLLIFTMLMIMVFLTMVGVGLLFSNGGWIIISITFFLLIVTEIFTVKMIV